MSLSSTSGSHNVGDRPPMNIIAADLSNSNASGSDDISFRESTTGSGSGSNEYNRYSYVGNESLARILLISRILIMALLMGMAIGCTFVTFLFTKRVEVKNFERLMEDFASEIVSASHLTTENIITVTNSMSIAITTHALDKNEEWPFVTMPFFDVQAQQVLEASEANFVSFCPLVSQEQRSAWGNWSITNNSTVISPMIYRHVTTSKGVKTLEVEPSHELDGGFYAPIWQTLPSNPGTINLDLLQDPVFVSLIDDLNESSQQQLGAGGAVLSKIDALPENVPDDEAKWPFSYLTVPVHDNLDGHDSTVGLLTVGLPWHAILLHSLSAPEGDAIVVVRNTCDQEATYQVGATGATFLGSGDIHDRAYDRYETTEPIVLIDELSHDHSHDMPGAVATNCTFSLHIYPSPEFLSDSKTANPIIYSFAVFLIFFIATTVFITYDCFAQKYQRKVLSSAKRTNAIVSSLFPAQVRARLMAGDDYSTALGSRDGDGMVDSFNVSGKKIPEMGKDEGNEALLRTPPIADLFTQATVMFADIAGFTAWSSVREPTQVFTLLEQIYNSFDAVAKRRKIFKVETIGDCYVAVAGLPEPRADHAEVMARFSHECRAKMRSVVKKLEVLLGPDTSDLRMRFGLHSGPVTAGVLRGDKSRFQLFGDTVNTASRIETSGARDMIQLSEDTAKCLIKAGKEKWVKPRDTLVAAKGKGMMQTYWLTITREEKRTQEEHDSLDIDTEGSTADSEDDSSHDSVLERTERLIDWITDVLHGQIRKIVAMRESCMDEFDNANSIKPGWQHLRPRSQTSGTVLDEVKEIIPLNHELHEYRVDPESVVLPAEAVRQLRNFVSEISGMYQDNPFHAFEHATHVTMSVTKLLSRIVSPDSITLDDLTFEAQSSAAASKLHQHTFGITSDPLIQFACAFSALIHDVDHPGVTNAQLVKEEVEIASLYKNKSVAEQNSVDLAWELLMEPDFAKLRQCIYTNQEELDRFRSLVVNSVMATDICDKELGAARKARWTKAFDENRLIEEKGLATDGIEEVERQDIHRKATIVIEHIIQASDISHTMQHWHIYLKWNEKFFQECYNAYKEGRAETNPLDGWYKGEMGFYDFYIIPLTKKLKNCGVFGVSSDEYLNYALENRREWELKGKDIVAGYAKKYCKEKDELTRRSSKMVTP